MDTVASRRPDDVDVKPPSRPDTVLSIPDLPLGFHLFVPTPYYAALPTPLELSRQPPPPPPPPGSYPQQQPPPPPPPGSNQQPPPGNAQQPPPSGNYFFGPPPPPPTTSPPAAGGGQARGVGVNEEINSKPFNDPAIRNKFIFKVYAILSAQLLVTAVIIGFISMTEEGREFIRIHMWLAAVAVCLQFMLFFVLVCCEDVRRKVPLNFILLSIYTVAMAIFASAVAAGYHTIIVTLAFGLTAMVAIIVTIVATLPCFDMTKYGGILSLFSLIFFALTVASYVFWVYFHNSFMNMIYCAIGVLLFTAYLLYDTQRILGGRTIEMSPEDYILGAICLYFDIIAIFIYMIRMLGACSKSSEN